MEVILPPSGIEMNSPEYWDFRYCQNIFADNVRIDLPGFELWASKLRKKDRIIDFGCGRGFFLEWLKSNYPKLELHGCDISKVAKEESIKRVPDLNWHFDINKIPDEYFNCVFCIHTVEHFEKPEECIAMLKRILKPRGWLVVVIPYQDQEWIEHYKIWEKEDIEELFNQFDCNVEIKIREATNFDPNFNKSYRKLYLNGTPFREAVCFVRFH